MLDNLNQTNITDTEILLILDCTINDATYQLFEVATATSDCLF